MKIGASIKTLSLLASLLMVGSADVFAVTRTVNSDGTGDYLSIQECADDAHAGVICLVGEGTYDGVRITNSGDPGNPIIFRADPIGSQPIVTGNFNFTDESHVVVDGFYMDNASFSGSGCTFIQIRNNTIDKPGIGLNGIAPGDDILIDGNTFASPVANDIINQWGTRWVIRNNIVTNVDDESDEHLDFWQTWCPADNASRVPGQYTLIENNLYADITGSNVHFTLFNTSKNPSCVSDREHYIIRYNKIRNIGSNSVVFTDHNGGPGFTGVAVYNNLFAEPTGGNRSTKYTIRLDAVIDGFAPNNMFYNALKRSDAIGVAETGIFMDGSLVYDTEGPVSINGSLASSTGVIPDKDPLFENYQNNNFTLKSGSPAENKGSHLTTVADLDSGTSRSLVVNAACYFQDGWAGVEHDWIAVGSVDNVVRIASINYKDNTLMLADEISRSKGDSVYLYRDSDGTQVLIDSAPDIGPEEIGKDSETLSAPTGLIIRSTSN